MKGRSEETIGQEVRDVLKECGRDMAESDTLLEAAFCLLLAVFFALLGLVCWLLPHAIRLGLVVLTVWVILKLIGGAK